LIYPTSHLPETTFGTGKYGSFDATFCRGILYHMDRPRAFLELLSRVTKSVIILHPHFRDRE